MRWDAVLLHALLLFWARLCAECPPAFLGCDRVTGQEPEPPPLLILLNQTRKPELTVSLGTWQGARQVESQKAQPHRAAHCLAQAREQCQTSAERAAVFLRLCPWCPQLCSGTCSSECEYKLFPGTPARRVTTLRFSSYLDNAPAS